MRLRYGGGVYDRTVALLAGIVKPEGVELEYVGGVPNQIFRRMFDTAEFDVSEMSAGNYLSALTQGEDRFVGLPIFPSRVFRHGSIFVRTDAGIERPEDLRGRRVGVPEYGQTANVWVRAILQHEYGVHAREIHWVRGDTEKIALQLPPGVVVEDAPRGVTLSELLERGEIDAVAAPEKPACFVAGSPRVRRLFPDFPAVEADYYRRTGHFPIMHLVVMRRDVYERDRTLPRRLYAAFQAAKAWAYEQLARAGTLATSLAFQTAAYEQQLALLGDDPFAYGVARARATVEALAGYVYEQGLASRVVALEELFVPELLDT
jgi:4,5-dihydroxyphthalate decarboxylase